MHRLNGLEHLLFRHKYVKESWVAEHVYGREELYKVVEKYTPSLVSSITGVPEEDLIEAAHIIGKSTGLLSTALQGVYQSNQATASACQINNINLLLGRIGKPGCGIYQMNGQPTAQNNRETGCDGEFPGFRNHQNPAHMQELADLWNIEFGRVPHWNEVSILMNLNQARHQSSDSGSSRYMFRLTSATAHSCTEHLEVYRQRHDPDAVDQWHKSSR
jgi:ferredoxin-nitrate reductase